MPGAWQYLNGRSYTRLDTHWNTLGIDETRLANFAANSIAYRRTPAVIGTGWLTTSPLPGDTPGNAERSATPSCGGTGQEIVTDTSFYVNNGWGGGGNGEWIDAGTWFAGEIYPERGRPGRLGSVPRHGSTLAPTPARLLALRQSGRNTRHAPPRGRLGTRAASRPVLSGARCPARSVQAAASSMVRRRGTAENATQSVPRHIPIDPAIMAT